jgi:hypothetical protein
MQPVLQSCQTSCRQRVLGHITRLMAATCMVQCMTPREVVAAQLSAAALTQVAMGQGPSEFRPFPGPNRPLLQSLWEILHDDAAGLWPEEACALSSPVVHNVLPSAQREYLRHAAPGAFKSLPDCFCAAGPAGLNSQAQLRSCAIRPASIFLDTLPMAAPLAISYAAFTSGMHHCLATDAAGCPSGGL